MKSYLTHDLTLRLNLEIVEKIKREPLEKSIMTDLTEVEDEEALYTSLLGEDLTEDDSDKDPSFVADVGSDSSSSRSQDSSETENG